MLAKYNIDLAKYNILVMNQNSFCKLHTILCMHRFQWQTLGVGQAGDPSPPPNDFERL